MTPHTCEALPVNILLLQAERDVRDITQAILQDQGHTVCSAGDGRELLESLGSFQPDILIIDIDQPVEDALQLMQSIRSAEPAINIIACTANKRLEDRLTGYQYGADVCLTKPIAPQELSAVTASLLRRGRRETIPFAGNGLQLDPARLELRGPQGKSGLSHQECSLLEAFSHANRHRLDHQALMALSGKSAETFSKAALEVQIVRLRKKLEEAGAPTPTIKSIRGVGYQLCVSIAVPPASTFAVTGR